MIVGVVGSFCGCFLLLTVATFITKEWNDGTEKTKKSSFIPNFLLLPTMISSWVLFIFLGIIFLCEISRFLEATLINSPRDVLFIRAQGLP